MSITITLFGQILTFIVLVWFIQKFLWGPITEMMEARSKRIADGLAASERGKHELELAEQRSAERLREAKQDASDIIVAANKRSNEIIEDAKEQGRVEGQRQIEVAVSEIEQEVNRIKEDLRRQFVNLTLATAEKILEREVDATAHDEFLNKMLKKL
ncbi:ATP synthase subunit B [Candidatus Thiomargarita nelsonii]|uniref:ATP synthase subunit b n=1 Tax=Candidatus Thiomargarita nelsonii TaxID=1003181 RepID=A0A0A6PJT3_9GAMM|nr:ATP synthase subunit B [Candidatus Thiomargarita nelsonii]